VYVDDSNGTAARGGNHCNKMMQTGVIGNDKGRHGIGTQSLPWHACVMSKLSVEWIAQRNM